MKVSILMVTYNQEKYIAQAVESVLMQETDFDMELVIGEDYSTDHTREILVDLQAKHPNKIKLLPSEKNLGVNLNIARTIQACTGQYLAFLDGDDYWISPHKLAKQVDYMDRHPDITVCYHNALVMSKDGTVLREWGNPVQKPISTLEDLIRRNFIASCTVMYRHSYVSHFPDGWQTILNADWTLHIFHAQHGNIGYIPEIMAAYRYNPEGIWRKLTFEDRIKTRIRSYNLMNQCLNYQYDSLFQPVIAEHWRQLRVVTIEMGFIIGQEDPQLQAISKIFENWPEDLTVPPRWKTEILIEIYNRLLFHHYYCHHYSFARYSCMRLALLKPSSLRNKGILKAFIISMLS